MINELQIYAQLYKVMSALRTFKTVNTKCILLRVCDVTVSSYLVLQIICFIQNICDII